MKNWKKVFGYSILVLIFASFLAVNAIVYGVKLLLIALILAGILIGSIILAVKLITSK